MQRRVLSTWNRKLKGVDDANDSDRTLFMYTYLWRPAVLVAQAGPT